MKDNTTTRATMFTTVQTILVMFCREMSQDYNMHLARILRFFRQAMTAHAEGDYDVVESARVELDVTYNVMRRHFYQRGESLPELAHLARMACEPNAAAYLPEIVLLARRMTDAYGMAPPLLVTDPAGELRAFEDRWHPESRPRDPDAPAEHGRVDTAAIQARIKAAGGVDPRDPDDAVLHALLGPLGIDRWEVRDGTLWITALRHGNTKTKAFRAHKKASDALGPNWRVAVALDRVEGHVTLGHPEPQQASATKPSDLVQRLVDLAHDRGLDVVVIPSSRSAVGETVVRVVGGPDQGIHALRRDLAGPCGARGALVVDGRHSKLHDVTAGDPEPQQASADPDVTRTRDLRREIEAAGGNMEGP